MIPGPLAAATYAAIKMTGYAGFAYGLNRVLGSNVRIWKFGATKIAVGLSGGLFYLYMLDAIGSHGFSDAQVFAGALPIRLLAWRLAFALFYDFGDRPKVMTPALLAGVIWTYLLDGLMTILYYIPGIHHLPGMEVPFC